MPSRKGLMDYRASDFGLLRLVGRIPKGPDINFLESGPSYARQGQSLLEFAFVLVGFLALLLALWLLVKRLQTGLILDHALQSATHQLQASLPGVVADIWLY